MGILKLFFKNKKNIITTLGLILFGVFMVFIIPIVFIFSLRLIGLEVEYSFNSWVGSLILLSLLSSGGLKSKE